MLSSRLPDYFIPGVQSWDERRRNVEHAMTLGLPRLQISARTYRAPLTIACYGPSLRDTYRDMRKQILSVSGAHDFLIERRVIPDFHVECDPRAHKAKMLTLVNPTTEYLIASCCHPDVFRALDGCNVKLWHLDNGPESRAWAAENDPQALCISGGSTVGLRAFEITHVLGYRSMDVHGMDCSFEGLNQWAGKHSGERKSVHFVHLDGSMRKYATTPLMVQQAREAVTFWRTHDVPMRFRGSGLCQAMWKHSRDNQ